MHTVYVILYLIAAVCFVAAACNVRTRVNLVALGLLAWLCVPLIVTLRAG